MESLHTLVDRLAEAADSLDDPEVTALVWSLKEHYQAPRLQVLILGATGSGRASIANALLGQPVIAPSPIAKAPVSVSVRHGPASVEVVGHEGARTALSSDRLRALLTDPSASERYRQVEVRAPLEPLTICDLRLEPLEADRSPEAWQSLLAGSDVVIVVLSATALLSQLERNFIREQIAEVYGLQRAILIINRMDLVPTEEQASIRELVATFLGPFEGQPVTIFMSATDDRDVEGRQALSALTEDFAAQRETLRGAALRRALETAVSELVAGTARQEAMIELDRAEVEGLQRSMADRRLWLKARIERSQRKVDAFVGTLIREQLQRDIEHFGQVFRRRLPEEVLAVEDLTTVKRYLPGYVERVWRDFLNDRMIAVRDKLEWEGIQLERIIESDLRELLAEMGLDLETVLGELDPAGQVRHIFVMPRRGDHKATQVARGLGLYGFVMLFFFPPLGLVSLAASQIVPQLYRDSIARSDKEAIIASASEASRELERQLQEQVEKQFVELLQKMKAAVAEQYEEGIARVEAFLQESLARSEDLESRRRVLAHLNESAIPELRDLLARLNVEAGTAVAAGSRGGR